MSIVEVDRGPRASIWANQGGAAVTGLGCLDNKVCDGRDCPPHGVRPDILYAVGAWGGEYRVGTFPVPLESPQKHSKWVGCVSHRCLGAYRYVALIVWLKVQVPTRWPFSTRIIYLASGAPCIVDRGLLSQSISISRRFPPLVSGSFLDVHLPTQGFLIAQIHPRRCRRLTHPHPAPSSSVLEQSIMVRPTTKLIVAPELTLLARLPKSSLTQVTMT